MEWNQNAVRFLLGNLVEAIQSPSCGRRYVEMLAARIEVGYTYELYR